MLPFMLISSFSLTLHSELLIVNHRSVLLQADIQQVVVLACVCDCSNEVDVAYSDLL